MRAANAAKRRRETHGSIDATRPTAGTREGDGEALGLPFFT